MASGPMTSWQVDGVKMETVADLIFLVSKITVDSECSHEIKRQLLLCRKAMNNLDQPMTLFNIVNETEVDIFSAIILLYLWSNGCW